MPVGTRPCPSADPQKGASLKCPLRIRSRFILTCAILSCAPRKYTKELRWAEGLRLWLPQGMGGSRCLVPVPRVRTASAQGVQGPRHGGGGGGEQRGAGATREIPLLLFAVSEHRRTPGLGRGAGGGKFQLLPLETCVHGPEPQGPEPDPLGPGTVLPTVLSSIASPLWLWPVTCY